MEHKKLTQDQKELDDLRYKLSHISDCCDDLSLQFLKLSNKCKEFIESGEEDVDKFYDSEDYNNDVDNVMEDFRQMLEDCPYDYDGPSNRSKACIARLLGFKDSHIVLTENTKK